MKLAIDLSAKERSELENLLKLDTTSRPYQRALALLLLDEGQSVEEVAGELHVSRQTVYNWISRFERRSKLSIAGRVEDGERSGRPPTVQGVIEPLMDEVLDLDPRLYGYNSTSWTALLLRQYLFDQHGLLVGLRSIGSALARLRVHWKYPRYVLRRREPFWQQAKGGSRRGSGGGIERWS